MNEAIVLILFSGWFCFMIGALIVGFRAARDLWTWKDLQGKKRAWILAIISIGFAIAFAIYVLFNYGGTK